MPDDSNTGYSQHDRAMDRAFALVAYHVNRHLVDHMLRMARELSMDFECAVLLGILAHQNVAHLMPPGTPPTSVLDETGRLKEERAAELHPLRIRDLVQISGIPRETVRRKLALLESAGHVRQVDGGWIVDRGGVDESLREFTRESVRRLLQTAQTVNDILRGALAAGERAKD
jgi:hypothetical protein